MAVPEIQIKDVMVPCGMVTVNFRAPQKGGLEFSPVPELCSGKVTFPLL